MPALNVNKAEFIKSAAQPKQFINSSIPAVAFAGKSNVGKSSVINRLLNRKNFARVGSAPGKTIHVNYFLIDGRLYLIDLPGYGFAKVSQSERERWGKLMESYLSGGSVSHIFMLIDIRHEPTAADKQMLEWIIYYGIPYTLIATKADKLSRSKRQQAANANAKLLGAPPWALCYSAETGDGREELVARIGAIVNDSLSNAK